jgi:hypothetical protein
MRRWPLRNCLQSCSCSGHMRATTASCLHPGEARMQSMLPALQPHVAHGGRAALVVRSMRMPRWIDSWAATLAEEVCIAVRGGMASMASADENFAAFEDMQRGTCEFLRRAGPALAQQAQPFATHDFPRAMGPCNALEAELA